MKGKTMQDLSKYSCIQFSRGRARLVEALWIISSALFVSSWIPGSTHRVWLLRLFGADIGKYVIIKPLVKVKFPWRLKIGDYSWIGEAVWVDNLAYVRIGSHCCISQGAYLCTGSHDYARADFALVTEPIDIQDHAWLAAYSKVLPGVIVEEGALLGMASVATKDLMPNTIYFGIPAVAISERPVLADDH